MNRESHGFLTTLWQHKWLLTICVLVSIGITSLALAFYPARYRSQTVLVLMPTRVPDEYIHTPKSVIDIADRITTIQQQMLTRTRLERIVMEFNLYDDARKRDLMEDVVQRMRHDIRIEVVGHDAVRIGFDGSDPKVVYRVAERLASLFINESLENRASVAENTSQFIKAQLDATRQSLDEQEAAINARTKGGHPMSTAESIEFDVLQQQYRELLTKRQTAEVANNLERRQIGEQVKLLDAARIPTEPITPNRKAATASGAAAGLGVGVALIGLTTRRRRLGTDVDANTTGVER